MLHSIKITLLISLLAALPFYTACSGPGQTERVDGALLEREIRYLADDEFEGRLPGSPGGERAEAYLAQRFQEIGLQPGAKDRGRTSYRQQTPLISIQTVSSPLTLGGRKWNPTRDFVAFTLRTSESENLTDSPLVFVGYGIHAPELGWDDYAGLDVRGKTVVMLINDPGFFSEDPDLFRGKAMTYYGRWTYKFEEAARQGAAGALIIHDTDPASYPWAVVRNSWTGPQLHIQPQDGNVNRCHVEGWIQKEVGAWLFQQAGRDLEEETQRALQRGFRGYDLDMRASIRLRNGLRRFTSDNILGVLPGTERPEEAVIVMAHWDHLGKNPVLQGDNIFNGALDNATGTGGLLALATAVAAAGPQPRSILFAAVTAEEQGLLGSEWLARNPPMPTRNIVATVNMDGLNVYGPTEDIEVIGYGFSELDQYLAKTAKRHGRTIAPDSRPERGSYFRSDHFSLAKVGVPGLYTKNGRLHREKGPEWVEKAISEYVANRYHRPADQYENWWRLDGAREDLELLLDVILRLAQEKTFPQWAKDSEFRAAREADGR